MENIKVAKVINKEEEMLKIAVEYLADTDIVMIQERGKLRKQTPQEWMDLLEREIWKDE